MKLIDIFNGLVIDDNNNEYQLVIDGRNFSLDPNPSQCKVKTALNFIHYINKESLSCDGEFTLEIKSNKAIYSSTGYKKFEHIEDCISRVEDDVDIGIVYYPNNVDLYMNRDYFTKNCSFLDFMTSEIVDTSFLRKYLVRRNKIVKWICLVCDMSIFDISYESDGNYKIRLYNAS